MQALVPMFKFQLFVAGDTPNSVEALGNLTRLCDEYLPGRHEIDVVDVFREPARALAEGNQQHAAAHRHQRQGGEHFQ